jgi:hypothetical protein
MKSSLVLLLLFLLGSGSLAHAEPIAFTDVRVMLTTRPINSISVFLADDPRSF